MSEINKWALPPGVLERPSGPIYSLAPDGSAHLIYITYQKMKEIGPIPRKLWPFESTR